MLDVLAMQQAVVAERHEAPFINQLVAEAYDFAGRDLNQVALAGGQVLDLSAHTVTIGAEVDPGLIKEKKPIGKQHTVTVDASETGKIEVITKNYGHDANGNYTDPNEPASSWINGVFQGHGITADKALARAIETGALPVGATEADLAKAGNDLYYSVKGPKGNWIVLGEIIGVENHSGDISSSGEIDVVAELSKKGITLTRAQLAKLEVLAQVKGPIVNNIGHTSLGVVVVSPVKPVTPTVPSTTRPAPTTTFTLPPSTTTTAKPPVVTVPKVPTTTMLSTTTIPTEIHVPATTIAIPNVPGITEIANTGNRPINGQVVTALALLAGGSGAALLAGARKRRKQPATKKEK